VRSLVSVLTLLAVSTPAFSWNGTGHRVIAFAAWQRLKPKTRERVIALLERHPDYKTILTQGVPETADRETRARAAFLMAAVWPDMLRSDPRFYDPARNEPQPQRIAGFPDQQKHGNWHYKDIPFSPDGTPLGKPDEVNAETAMAQILNGIDKPIDDPASPAYLLPWLLHIVGDVHQPLHCTSRYVKAQPTGDRGGNEVWVEGPRRLHAYWDDLPGRDESIKGVETIANALPFPWRVRTRTVDAWIKEGFEIARTDVYSFGFQVGSREQPIQLPNTYRPDAEALARKRMAIAAIRLAHVLNDKLGR
jgi:hypothetical protein